MEHEYIYLEEPTEVDHSISPVVYWLLGVVIGYGLGKSSNEK